MSDERPRFVVVGEDHVHRALAMKLVDAVITDEAHQRQDDWIEPDGVRRWSVRDEGDRVPPDRRWHDIHNTPIRHIHGHLDGKPIGPGGRKFRAILIDYANAPLSTELVVILQDTDNDDKLIDSADRVSGWASRQDDLPTCVIGTPHREAEAWFLAIPTREPDEQRRLDAARTTLKFNPAHEPERLTAQSL